MPIPNSPSNRRPTGRIGARGPASRPPSVRQPAPPRPQAEDPLEDDDRGVAGRRGEPVQSPQDRKVIKYGIIGGVAIIVIGVAIGIATKKAPEPPPKETPKPVTSTGWPSADTPEGRADIEKMFNSAAPDKLHKYLSTIGPETALKIKDTLINFMSHQDARGIGLSDAIIVAERLSSLKDPRILNKVIELAKDAKDRDYAADPLKTYGAMGSQAVIDRATADKPEAADAYYAMLLKCQPADATGPMVTAAETSEAPHVAWICGDALYRRDIAIKTERIQAWLADPSPRAKASGLRQMAIQKGTDRDAAIAPFATAETPLEVKISLLDVLAERHDLSTDHMKKILALDDLEIFNEAMARISSKRLTEYIPVLEEMANGERNGKTRLVSKTLADLKFLLEKTKK